MTKPVKEFVIEDYYVAQIEKHFPGSQTHKYEIRRTEPDRITLIPGGIAVFVELKRPKKEPREDQYRALERLTKLGFFADWANTKEGVDYLIERLHNYVKTRTL
jgi:hypothetical protein